MLINTIANIARTQRGEPLTIAMLKAELKEMKSLTAVTVSEKIAKKQHLKTLEAAIRYKENRQQ